MPTTVPSSEEGSPRRLIVAQHKDGIALTLVYEGTATSVVVHPGQLTHAIEVEKDRAAKEREDRVRRYAEALQVADRVAMKSGEPFPKYIAAAEAAIDAREAAE